MTTLYIGNYAEYRPSTNTLVKYYYAGSQRVAMREGASTLFYFLSDHLGSTSLTLDSTGTANRVAELRYKPWGEQRYSWGTTPTQRRFTGQLLDSGTGLYFYNARYYDPGLGRFIQADTIVPEAGNPQALNRYSYVANNPLKYVDPSGHCWGIAAGIRNTQVGAINCSNIDSALAIVQNPDIPAKDRAIAATYLGGWGIGVTFLAGGGALLACGLTPICAAAAEAGLGIGSAACADGNCTNEAITVAQWMQRAGQIRQNLRLTPRRNVAIADYSINGTNGTIVGISGQTPTGTVGIPSQRFFDTTSWNEFSRAFDSEVKILENIAHMFAKDAKGVYPSIRGTIRLFTEREPCPSCAGVIAQFREMFPMIELEIIYGSVP